MQRIAKKLTGSFVAFGFALIAGLSVPALVTAETTADIDGRLNVLEQQTFDLSRSISALGFSQTALTPPAAIGEDGALVAQSRDVAALNVKLSELENQIRILTGQVEGVQFQATQIYQQLERMQEDNDFRFQQLEAGLGKTDAVAQSGGAMPAGELPQSQTGDDFSNPSVLQTAPLQTSSVDPNQGDITNGGLPDQSGTVVLGEDEVLGGGGLAGLNGPLVLDLSSNDGRIDFGGSSITGSGQALSLDFDPGQLVTEGDARAQYQAGFEAVLQGDYDFAIAQFQQFVALFPGHELAPDASNWLGESLIQKQLYADAAEVLFAGFQKYENSTRAPELLLKLGVALHGAEERDTACRTFVEVTRRYPNMGGAFDARVADELAKAQC